MASARRGERGGEAGGGHQAPGARCLMEHKGPRAAGLGRPREQGLRSGRRAWRAGGGRGRKPPAAAAAGRGAQEGAGGPPKKAGTSERETFPPPREEERARESPQAEAAAGLGSCRRGKESCGLCAGEGRGARLRRGDGRCPHPGAARGARRAAGRHRRAPKSQREVTASNETVKRGSKRRERGDRHRRGKRRRREEDRTKCSPAADRSGGGARLATCPGSGCPPHARGWGSGCSRPRREEADGGKRGAEGVCRVRTAPRPQARMHAHTCTRTSQPRGLRGGGEEREARGGCSAARGWRGLQEMGEGALRRPDLLQTSPWETCTRTHAAPSHFPATFTCRAAARARASRRR